jgi:hypothetical protein
VASERIGALIIANETLIFSEIRRLAALADASVPIRLLIVTPAQRVSPI